MSNDVVCVSNANICYLCKFGNNCIYHIENENMHNMVSTCT